MLKLTKTIVDAAGPGTGKDGKPADAFIWDDDPRGFGLKITAGRSKVYICQYRTGGRGTPTKRVTIGRHGAPWTLETARRKARAILGAVASGGDPAAEKRARREAQKAPHNTVAQVAEEWLKRDQAGNRSLAEVRRSLVRDVLPVIGGKPIRELRKLDVIELLDQIVDRGSGIMANRTLSTMKRLLNWAASRDLVDSNVAQYVEPPADAVRRERVLSDEELAAVWHGAESMGGTYGAGVKLLLLTGARRDEIFGLHEAELDLEGAAIRLPAARSKTKEGRAIPLSPQAVAILEALPRLAGPYLLSATGERPRADFSRTKRQLDALLPDLAPWVIHDIRRSAATGMQRLGSRLETIEAVLGHVSGSRRGIVGTYQRHAFETEARAALDAWGRHIEGLVTGKVGNVVAMTARA